MNPFLFISSDLIDRQMAGQGIRCLELAKEISRHVAVRLAVPERCDFAIPGVEVVIYRYGEADILERAAIGVSGIFAEPFILNAYPALMHSRLPLVVDLYNPFPLEHLAVHRGLPIDEQLHHSYEDVEQLNAVCERGDFFTCATVRQRDWWLGVLQANGRINPLTSAQDPHLRRLVDVVGYGITPATGIEMEGPRAGDPRLRAEDKIILWGGGLWNWLDPLTLIRAMPTVLEHEPNARLYFPGTRHPNKTIVPDMEMRRAADELAHELGLSDQHVVFGDWMPYERWSKVLAESDVAVSFHKESPETRYAALRSRMYGYIGARLPIVAQVGDQAAETVAEFGLGEVVPPADPEAAAAALVAILRNGRDAYADRFTPLLQTLDWPSVAAPLIEFTRAPCLAADSEARRGAHPLRDDVAQGEVARLQALVDGYANGRVMRMLSRLQHASRQPEPGEENGTELQTRGPRPPGDAARHAAALVLRLNVGGLKRELRNYIAWKAPPLRRAAERQLRRLRRRPRGVITPTPLHRLYRYMLSDLGDQHPSLRGIYTPGYRSETVGNYLQAQFMENAEVYARKYTDYDYFHNVLGGALRRISFEGGHGTTILDIGSGAGNSIFPLLDLCPGAHIIASDLSIELLRMLQMGLRERGAEGRVTLLQLNAEDLDFEAGALDLVVGVAVLHHLFEPERTVRGCARVLKRNGHAVFLEPFAEGCLELARIYARILSDLRSGELPEPVRHLLAALRLDYEVRAHPDKTLPIFNKLDDKQLFTRAFFEEQARRSGFASCVVTPLHGKERQYERQTQSMLTLAGVAPALTLPEWAWEIIRVEDDALTQAVPIEACVVLSK